TAAGAPVAPFVIKALKSLPRVRVVAVDADPLSCGFQLADAHHVVPPVSSEHFVPALLDICREESVDLLFPDLDEELPLLAEARKQFESIGTRVLISDRLTVETCLDKYRTYQFLREHAIPTPQTWLPSQLGSVTALPFPVIVKPRTGRGSRNVFKATCDSELQFFLGYSEDALIQEFVEGL